MSDREPAVPSVVASFGPPTGPNQSTFRSSSIPLRSGFRSANWLLIVLTVSLFALLFPGIAVPMLTIGGKFTTGKPVPAGLRIGLVVWLAVGVWVMYRMIRTRFVLTDDALIVFNPAHTHRLPWAAIDYVEIRKIYIGAGVAHSPTAKVRVHPREGEPFAIAAASVNYRTRAKTLHELFSALAHHGVQVDDIT